MQLLFARILAGEIQRPSSFSIRTVKLLGSLDQGAAKLFQKLCSLCICIQVDDIIMDARVVSLKGNAASNALQIYGLGFDALNVLQEYGFIIADYNSYYDYQACCIRDTPEELLKLVPGVGQTIAFPFSYQNHLYMLEPIVKRAKNQPLKLLGVALSTAGKELLSIVDIEPSEQYTEALTTYFSNNNLKMVEI